MIHASNEQTSILCVFHLAVKHACVSKQTGSGSWSLLNEIANRSIQESRRMLIVFQIIIDLSFSFTDEHLDSQNEYFHFFKRLMKLFMSLNF